MGDNRVRNVLVIAYEFPPSAGGGVQRVTKLVRYLPEFGWRPYVLSAKPAWGATTDQILLDQVSHAEVRSLPNRNVAATIARCIAPFKLPRSSPKQNSRNRRDQRDESLIPAVGGQSMARRPLSSRLARRFFVDSAEPWALSVPRSARRWAREVDFDLVFATGPPHTSLVAGARTARALGIPYVAEMRDAWGQNPGYRWASDSGVGSRSARYEDEALRSAASVLTVSEPIASWATAAGASSTIVVPNGFDSEDVPHWSPTPGPLRIAFMGRFYGTTDPAPFIEGMGSAVRSGGAAGEIHLDVAGSENPSVRQALAERGLANHVTFHGFRPHPEALRLVASADVGLLVIADKPGSEAIYSSKIFEYLGVGVPILLVGPPHGAAAALVAEADAGMVVPYSDPERVAAALVQLAEQKATGALFHKPRAEVVARFERRRLVGQVARVFDRVVGSAAGPGPPSE